MSEDPERITEHTHLLPLSAHDGRLEALRRDSREHDAQSVISSHFSKEELVLGSTALGERLPYNDYTTIDWLHDLVKDSYRLRSLRSRPGLRYRLLLAWDSCQGWVAAAITGVLTACVAFLVDVAEVTVSDWKVGYCTSNAFLNRDGCCTEEGPGPLASLNEDCPEWRVWSTTYQGAFGIYTGFAILFGIISASVTMLTKSTVTAVSDPEDMDGKSSKEDQASEGKTIFLAAGSGIPEIKTILSGFVIPGILSVKVLVIKAIGAVFAVATGMCLGKEGPFVHISTCVAYQVAKWFPKYRENGRKLREMLSAGCAAGLSVAFGAPIGGVLFSYEEISTYFPRKVLWRAFLCSLCAAVVLKALNPTGTGKLVLFESNFQTTYQPVHYVVFVLLGIVGGLFGGTFCKINFLWSKSFRTLSLIKKYPVLEVALVVLATALIQYPNPMTREPGDIIIKNLLVDCREPSKSWVCEREAQEDRSSYIGWLVYGTLAKLLLTIVTFGAKVPSGVIIPALDAGAFFGRLIGQTMGNSISPGIFAMIGAAAFLAGVSRMTLSLVVIMFELTGELEYIVPHMIAILVAKWIADALEKEGVYDLAQTVLGHPFLDVDQSLALAQQSGELVAALIPPRQTMVEITVHLPTDGRVPRKLLAEKLSLLKRRGLVDAGLVLVSNGMLQGYLSEGELDFGLTELGKTVEASTGDELVCLTREAHNGELDLSHFVDRTPLTLSASAPIEYLVEMFGKLGLRYLCIVEEGSSRLLGVVIKKRLVLWLEERNSR